jgi:hypothetical protein
MSRLPTLAFAALLLAGCASTGRQYITDPDMPRNVGEGSPVLVHWGDPSQFGEVRYSQNRYESLQGDWVVELADYLQQKVSKALPPGERADVEIVDIRLAGQYEWIRNGNTDLRVMRDVYPPRMTLRFRRMAADGSTIAEGERKIADLAYLQSPGPFPTTDPLRYDKRLIDRWIRREFK